MSSMKKALLGYILWLGLASVSAEAATVTWTLQDVQFSDGTTATGSFDYDADSNTYSAIYILTQFNQGLGATYGTATASSSSSFIDIWSSPNKSVLLLFLEQSMSNAGGTIDLVLGLVKSREGLCRDTSRCNAFDAVRGVTSGYISAPSAVPVPAALPLLASGLGALGVIGWRRKRTKVEA